MRARLLDKTVIIEGKKREVYGLADFYTKPTRIGLGRHCLRFFKFMAERNNKYCVILFCDDDVCEFYSLSGYHYLGKYKGKNMFGSILVNIIKPTELW